MEKELFDDLIESCQEAIQYQKGDIKLKSRIVEIPDDDINDIYNKLTDNDKYLVRGMINRLLASK